MFFGYNEPVGLKTLKMIFKNEKSIILSDSRTSVCFIYK